MDSSKTKSARLRQMLDSAGSPLVAPCAYDCVSARVVELAGLPLVLHGGFNTAASMLGIADVGLITQTEMLDAARRMARAVEIPVIADVDDGFGKPLNVARTTEEAILAGVAGFYIEDQVFPKRCPSLGGNAVVSMDEIRTKLKTVRHVSAALDPDFVVMARTHASLAISFEEGLKRGEIIAKERLADLIWVDLGYDDSVLGQLEAIAKRIAPHGHVVANMTENVGRPLLKSSELGEMGFKVIVYPVTLILTAAAAMVRVTKELVEKETTAGVAQEIMPIRDFTTFVKFDKVKELESQLARYGA